MHSVRCMLLFQHTAVQVSEPSGTPTDVEQQLEAPPECLGLFKTSLSIYSIINRHSFVIRVSDQKENAWNRYPVHCRVHTIPHSSGMDEGLQTVWIIEKHKPAESGRWISTLGQIIDGLAARDIMTSPLLKFQKHVSLKLGTPRPTHPCIKSHLTTDGSFNSSIQEQGHTEGTMFQVKTN